MPLANELSHHVSNLRVKLGQARERSLIRSREAESLNEFPFANDEARPAEQGPDPLEEVLRSEFRSEFESFKRTLAAYRERLDQNSGLSGARIGDDRLVHVQLSTPVEICRQRDRSGRYQAADRGAIVSFPGVTFAYEPPQDADLIGSTAEFSSSETVSQICELLQRRGVVD
ncbi:MAG: adenylyl-sulfate kinase, partial [Planctomycetota bacterium]